MEDRTAALALRYLTAVVPAAAAELRRLKKRASGIADRAIRAEALSSLRRKAFHVHGACVFATFLKGRAARHFVRLVATYETAVDYLDNLCDRIGREDEADFRALHEALADAVTPGAPPRAYFRRRAGDDSGYLEWLVRDAQTSFAALPAYGMVRDDVVDITGRYCELQALKHLARGERERRCERAFSQVAPDLRWWEGAAASGSTMATFALAFAAVDAELSAARSATLRTAYFPYFTALHILLDYFVDQQEDREHDELNFVACYPDAADERASFVRIAERASRDSAALPDADVHRFALQAMCGYYCTRRSVRASEARSIAADVMRAVGLELDPATQMPRIGGRRVTPLLQLYARMAR